MYRLVGNKIKYLLILVMVMAYSLFLKTPPLIMASGLQCVRSCPLFNICPPGEQCLFDSSCGPVCGAYKCYSCLSTAKDKVDIGRDFFIALPTTGPLGFADLTDNACYATLSGFISCFLPTIYIIAGVILLFLLIGGGFAIMMSTNDPQKKGQGSKAITAAIIGFLVLFTSYWIVQLIQKLTGVPIFDTSGILF